MKNTLLVLLVVLSACTNNESTSGHNNTFVIATDSVALDIMAIELELVRIGDSVFVQKGDSILIREYLSPIEYLTEDSLTYTQDEARFLANCLIIMRGVQVLGPFCHIPQINSVEIHTLTNGVKLITKEMVDYWAFQGNSFNSPNKDWAVINKEAEGDVYGVAIIHSNGNVQELDYEFDMGYSGITYDAEFINDTTLFFPTIGSSPRNANTTLLLYKNSTYRIDLPPHEEDTIRFLSYFGHEVFDLPYYQYYWKVIKVEPGLFRIESARLEQIASDPPQYSRLNSFGEPIAFIYTGLNACNELIEADDSIQYIDDGSTVTLQANDTSNVKLSFINGQILLGVNESASATIADLSKLPEYVKTYTTQIAVSWVGDLDCDNLNEIIIEFEVGNIFYFWVLKSNTELEYHLAADESLYWD